MIPVVDYAERETRLKHILDRNAAFDPSIDASVREIIQTVRREGDRGLIALTERFDRVRLERIDVPASEIDLAYRDLEDELKSIIREAAGNIRTFHQRQIQQSWFTEDADGVILGQRVVPMERVGLYVPGGTAFYPSSLLMNAIPAQVAGVHEIVLVSPPGPTGMPHPLVLATAGFLGLERVMAVGGAQAVAALAYGTETVPRVDKIVGPGNAYVAAAKKMVYGPVDIDAIAGPTEIVILADEEADVEFVAADLIAQAEHDVRSSALLVTPSRSLAETVSREVGRRVPSAPRRHILEQSIVTYSACIVTPDLESAIDLVNELAAEHVELMVREPWSVLPAIKHGGALFLGPYSSEPVGDYFAGPNHVLPTGGTARYASALSVDDFVRKQSIIAYNKTKLIKTGPGIVRFAEAEALPGHAEAIQVRLNRDTSRRHDR